MKLTQRNKETAAADDVGGDDVFLSTSVTAVKTFLVEASDVSLSVVQRQSSSASFPENTNLRTVIRKKFNGDFGNSHTRVCVCRHNTIVGHTNQLLEVPT